MPPYVESGDRPKHRLGQALRLPTVSGKASAAWMVVCFLLTGAFAPMILRLPIWIECEIVVGLWWLVWLVALSRLLYVGWHVSDDHQWTGPRSWFSGFGKKTGKTVKVKGSAKAESSSSSGGSDWGSLDLAADGLEIEGCAIGLAIIVGVIALFFGAWFLIEVAIPALALVLYLAVRGMLAQAINNGGACRDNFPRSLGVAVLWATFYTAPIAGAVWLIHLLHHGRLDG